MVQCIVICHCILFADRSLNEMAYQFMKGGFNEK